MGLFNNWRNRLERAWPREAAFSFPHLVFENTPELRHQSSRLSINPFAKSIFIRLC
jgi:hypothetical protein